MFKILKNPHITIMIFLQMDNKFILKFPTTDKYGTRDSRLTSLQCFYIYNLALILAGKKENLYYP